MPIAYFQQRGLPDQIKENLWVKTTFIKNSRDPKVKFFFKQQCVASTSVNAVGERSETEIVTYVSHAKNMRRIEVRSLAFDNWHCTAWLRVQAGDHRVTVWSSGN